MVFLLQIYFVYIYIIFFCKFLFQAFFCMKTTCIVQIIDQEKKKKKTEKQMESELLTNLELLMPIPCYNNNNHSDVHKKFTEALFIMFDVPKQFKTLRYKICDRDLLWLPSTINDLELYQYKLNYYQLASLETCYREPAKTVLWYLFSDREPYYNEEYELSQDELDERELFYQYLRNKYTNVNQYINRIKMFFDPPNIDPEVISIFKNY